MRYRNMCDYDHYKKLIEISNQSKISKGIAKNQKKQMKKVQSMKKQAKDFELTERNRSIFKHN